MFDETESGIAKALNVRPPQHEAEAAAEHVYCDYV